MFFEAVWQRLTLAQRAVLRAVVLERGVEMLGADVRARYRLGGASSVQAALIALQRLDVVARDDDGRYAAVDSLMREWVAGRPSDAVGMVGWRTPGLKARLSGLARPTSRSRGDPP